MSMPSKPTHVTRKPGLPAFDSPFEYLHIFVPAEVFSRGVHHIAFKNYVGACYHSVQQHAERNGGVSGYLRIAIEFQPGGARRATLWPFPALFPRRLLAEVASLLVELPTPPISGPVTFAIQVIVHNGCEVAPVFDSLSPCVQMASADFQIAAPANQAQGNVKPSEGSPWKRAVRWLRAQIGRKERMPAPPDADSSDDQPPTSSRRSYEGLDFAQLSQLIKDFPDEPGLYEARGVQLLQRGEPAQALEDFDQLLRLQPDEESTYIWRMQAQWRLRNLSGALKDVNQALQVCPPSVVLLAARSEVYCELGAWDAARNDLEQAMAIEPRDSNLYVWRSRTYFEQQNLDAAVADLHMALRYDPYALNALNALGKLLLGQSQSPTDPVLDEALATLNRAVWLAPGEINALATRAQVYAARGDHARALADCETAIEASPQNGYAWFLRGAVRLRSGSADLALADLDRAIELGHESPEALVARATAHFLLGNQASALADVNAALKADSTHVGALALRGRVQLLLGSPHEALDDLNDALASVPDNATWLLDRGHAWRELGDFSRAMLDYSRAIELDESLALAYANRGLCWLDQRRIDDAAFDFDRAITLQPDVPPGVYLHRGNLFMVQGKLEQAYVDFQHVVTVAPEWAAGYYQRSQVLTKMGRLAEARADLDRVIELDPQGGAFLSRGSLFIRGGQEALADADFEAAKEQNPEAAEYYALHRELVEIDRAQEEERYEAGIAQASAILENSPDCISARLLRASCYWCAEQFSEAADDLTICLEQSEDLLLAIASRGQILADMGEYEQALQDLDRALELADGNETLPIVAYAHRGRGVALLGLGRLDEAVQELELSIAACPENGWAQYSLGLYYATTDRPREAALCFRLALTLDRPRLTSRQRTRANAFLKKHDA